ncbi:membrane protein insertase YidC [Crenothrix polyspora]|uniref:Membrane protein insertase YidC n=1 Tax=Crenothrix polyspora TaxID=360316 RepID=A0A1R4HIV3_9GAMM|nr:membrane protein insertase YidC [Crenothrix polyspora]SJM95800.1 cytoplasmic insertase into membrane protein, Sec system [Crenothrix polyspora]
MDNIRFLLIIAFGFLVVLLWQSWQKDYGPQSLAAVTSSAPAVSLTSNHDDLPTATTASTSAVDVAQNATITAVPASKVISVKTDVVALEIDLQGGSIQNLDLLQYPEEKDNAIVNKVRALLGLSALPVNNAPIRVLNSKADRVFIAQSGLIAGVGAAAAPDHHSSFTSPQDSYELQPGQESLSVPLSWTNNNGLTVTKTFIFKPGSYEIGLEHSVKNDSTNPWAGNQYSQLAKLPFKEEKSGGMLTGMRAYDGGVIYTDKEKYQKVDFDDMVEKNLDVASQGGWAAMIQHYFASAWIPPADQENHFYTKYLKDGQYVIGSYSAAVNVAVGSSANFASRLFVGPKIQPLMEKAAPGLELTVDYGVLTFIGKPIYSLLNKIHNLTGNWGFSIIGVTLCIKLLLFPLTQSSFKSMANMRKVQPRLKELQERFADDRPRFNTEMMALYKKEKVNPLGGCFPILFQIPVFMSLYWVLGETVEFRHAPFMLWIQDLSSQDPFYILPVIMGITMKIQQGLNPAPVDPVQAKIMKMFPIVFTVFFLFFPAGLVLYWVINNTLSITQQTYITKQINKTA